MRWLFDVGFTIFKVEHPRLASSSLSNSPAKRSSLRAYNIIHIYIYNSINRKHSKIEMLLKRIEEKFSHFSWTLMMSWGMLARAFLLCKLNTSYTQLRRTYTLVVFSGGLCSLFFLFFLFLHVVVFLNIFLRKKLILSVWLNLRGSMCVRRSECFTTACRCCYICLHQTATLSSAHNERECVRVDFSLQWLNRRKFA